MDTSSDSFKDFQSLIHKRGFLDYILFLDKEMELLEFHRKLQQGGSYTNSTLRARKSALDCSIIKFDIKTKKDVRLINLTPKGMGLRRHILDLLEPNGTLSFQDVRNLFNKKELIPVLMSLENEMSQKDFIKLHSKNKKNGERDLSHYESLRRTIKTMLEKSIIEYKIVRDIPYITLGKNGKKLREAFIEYFS